MGGVAGGQVSGLRDGAMSLALLDERLVGGTGTVEDDKLIKVGSNDTSFTPSMVYNGHLKF